jgi:hypothetical protein
LALLLAMPQVQARGLKQVPGRLCGRVQGAVTGPARVSARAQVLMLVLVQA